MRSRSSAKKTGASQPQMTDYETGYARRIIQVEIRQRAIYGIVGRDCHDVRITRKQQGLADG